MKGSGREEWAGQFIARYRGRRMSKNSLSPIPNPLSAIELPREKMPRHIAVIMDGNGRWAQQRGLPRIEGHRQGAESVRRSHRGMCPAGHRTAHVILPIHRKLETPGRRARFPHGTPAKIHVPSARHDHGAQRASQRDRPARGAPAKHTPGNRQNRGP